MEELVGNSQRGDPGDLGGHMELERHQCALGRSVDHSMVEELELACSQSFVLGVGCLVIEGGQSRQRAS